MTKVKKAQVEHILPLPEAVISHHSDLTNLMGQWKQQKIIPPALLFTGIKGVGKRSIATWLAQWILCSDKKTKDGELNSFDLKQAPCGQCKQCKRALNGTWVDFVEILSEEESGTLKIDQFREMKTSARFGSFGANEGEYKVILIPNAERMTVQAANSMLKLLEEPPAGWIFLLTATDATLLPPTLLSRLQRLNLKPFERKTLRELLTKSEISAERLDVCIELAHGSWGGAFAFADDEIWTLRRDVLNFLATPVAYLSSLVDQASQDPVHFDLILTQLESLCADLISWSLTGSAWVNVDANSILAAHAKAALHCLGSAGAAREFWLERSERIFKARQESLTPLNKKLLIQDVLLPWLSI